MERNKMNHKEVEGYLILEGDSGMDIRTNTLSAVIMLEKLGATRQDAIRGMLAAFRPDIDFPTIDRYGSTWNTYLKKLDQDNY